MVFSSVKNDRDILWETENRAGGEFHICTTDGHMIEHTVLLYALTPDFGFNFKEIILVLLYVGISFSI